MIWRGWATVGFRSWTKSFANTQANPSVTIRLKKRVALTVRIDDAGQLLNQHLGKTPGADLLIGISRPGQPFRPTIPVSQDATGRDNQFVIPFDTAVRMVVASSFFRLADAKGAAFAGVSTAIPITVPAGQQPQPIHVTVIGRQ